MISVSYFLWLGIVLFSVGFYVSLSQQNIIKVLIGIEMMLNSAVLNFIIFSTDYQGAVNALFVMALAVAETVLALALLLKMKRKGRNIRTELI